MNNSKYYSSQVNLLLFTFIQAEAPKFSSLGREFTKSPIRDTLINYFKLRFYEAPEAIIIKRSARLKVFE